MEAQVSNIFLSR